MQENTQNLRKPSTQQTTQALLFKQQGNQYFKQKNYEEALLMYNNAIVKKIGYHSKKIQQIPYTIQTNHDEALEAAEVAIKRDEKNIKAHYLAAEALVDISEGTRDRGKLEMAIQRLKRSLTLCPSQGKGQFQRNFIQKILRAKKKLWLLVNQQQQEKRKAIRKYLIHLVETDQTLTQPQKDELNEKILKLVQSHTQNDNSKIPTALICPITKMLLKDPVCNQHGHSYSREPYLKYLAQNDNHDPITKKVVKKKNVMYPNINVKKAVEIFLEENPWAYDEVIA